MIRFAKYMLQSKMNPLYHATLAHTAILILNENRFRVGRSKLNPGGHSPQISFTRDITRAHQWGTIIFELDQQKIRRKYKIHPYRTSTHISDVVKKDIHPADQYITKIIIIAPTESDLEKEISYYTEEYPQIINDRRFYFYITQTRKFMRYH